MIELILKEQLHRFKNSAHPLLFQAAEHTLLNPGKRLRPLLVQATVESLGGNPDEALLAAAAIEILHTYSLIHDDLPCMDDDDLRRGKPTLHKLYGEGQAVLVGDLLLTLAFEVLATLPLPAEKSLKLIAKLAQRSGGQGMILGQSLDLFAEGKDLSWEELSFLHLRKTADLISCCLEFGAILCDAPLATEETLFRVGEKIGLSFQIIDDVLDVEGETCLIGKKILSDEANGKKTSVSLLGLEKAKELADALLTSALVDCEKIGLKASPLTSLLPKLVHRLC